MFNQKNGELWQTVVETMQEGLMLVDQQGKVEYVNPAFERMIGYPLDEVRGKSCEVFQCDRCFIARADGQDKYCTLFREEQARSSECVFRRRDGSAVHLLKNAAVIRDRQGKVIGGVETMIDLSRVVEKERIIASLRQQLDSREGFYGIVGTSPVMRQVLDLATSAAHSDAPLVIYGESGTGKEILASAVHRISGRKGGPFIKVNCAALNDNLLESELFGHVKGAFTGAEYNRTGRFEAANGGSIFLDEIGDLPLATQTKLLRVLQEREIERVGDHRPVKIDVRIIAATHKDLQQLIREGRFREDLYYRIGVIPVLLPPLRERMVDLPLLAETFIARIGERTGKGIAGITRDGLDVLLRYDWPGNIRELMNVLEYAFVLCPGGMIEPPHLPHHLQSGPVGLRRPWGGALSLHKDSRRQQLIEALEATGGNQTRAAKLLGVSRVTVWKWINLYDIQLGVRVQEKESPPAGSPPRS